MIKIFIILFNPEIEREKLRNFSRSLKKLQEKLIRKRYLWGYGRNFSIWGGILSKKIYKILSKFCKKIKF